MTSNNQSIMSSSSQTISSLLNTINVTAQSVTKTVSSAADGLDMLQAYVTKAKTQQSINHKIEQKNFLEVTLENSALETAERQKHLQNKLNSDEQLKKLFTEAYTELQSLFTETSPES